MGEWKTIDSAPKDGTPIDLWAAERERYVNSRISDCQFVNGRWVHHRTVYDDDEFTGGDDMAQVFNATHWMPLPPPPKD